MSSAVQDAVRTLGPLDIDAALRLSDAAGWNQTREDWARLLRLAPDAYFGLDVNGELGATGGAICYGSDLAWIGMVLTLPQYRGRGLARRLLDHLLSTLDQRRIRVMRLDATEMGRALYERLGFAPEGAVERWVRETSVIAGPDLPALGGVPGGDADIFGVDRTALLRDLLAYDSASISPQDYAMGRLGRVASYFGPCVASSPETARRMVGWFLALHGGRPVYWDLAAGHTTARDLAREVGFRCQRRLIRMVRGGPCRSIDERIYAIAGFEYG